jgi:hypothetical protein
MFSGKVDNKGDSYTFRYFTVLPQLQAAWKVSPMQTVSASYRGQNSLPSVQQVNPVTDLTNPQYPVTGNPGLKPSYSHTVGIHYEQADLQATQFSGFGGGVGYSITVNPIISSTVHPRDSSQVIQATSYTNAGQLTSLFADYHLTLPTFLKKRIRILLDGSVARSLNTMITDNQTYSNVSWNYNQTLHLQLIIPDHTEVDLQGNYMVTYAAYSSPSQIPGTIQSAAIAIIAKQYLLSQWSVSGHFVQMLTSGRNGLVPAPAALTASLQWQMLAHNMATISLTAYNLLNSMAGDSQAVSATSVTQTSTTYSGRYLLLTLMLKLQRFH